jgi:hypothetical protein
VISEINIDLDQAREASSDIDTGPEDIAHFKEYQVFAINASQHTTTGVRLNKFFQLTNILIS